MEQTSDERIRNSDCLLQQLDDTLAAAILAIDVAKKHGVRVTLVPAPVPSDPVPDVLFQVDLICPNKTEARRLTQVHDESFEAMQLASVKLHQRGAKVLAITLGTHGTLMFDGTNMQRVESIAINAVDTTGAGDWSVTQDLISAIRWANSAVRILLAKSKLKPNHAKTGNGRVLARGQIRLQWGLKASLVARRWIKNRRLWRSKFP